MAKAVTLRRSSPDQGLPPQEGPGGPRRWPLRWAAVSQKTPAAGPMGGHLSPVVTQATGLHKGLEWRHVSGLGLARTATPGGSLGVLDSRRWRVGKQQQNRVTPIRSHSTGFPRLTDNSDGQRVPTIHGEVNVINMGKFEECRALTFVYSLASLLGWELEVSEEFLSSACVAEGGHGSPHLFPAGVSYAPAP